MDIFFHFLTYGMLMGLSYGEPLIGKNVRDARPDELLFVVSIQRRAPISNDANEFFQNRHFCTGILISRKHLLTAAHCIINVNTSDVEVIAGSRDVSLGEKYYPESWTTYEGWLYNIKLPINQNFHDVAVITLEGQGVEDPKITPVSIATFERTHLYKQKVRIAGWGGLEDDSMPLILKTAVLTVISHDECAAKARKLIGENVYVREDRFCSMANPPVLVTPVNKAGDSGAPILNTRNQLVGINDAICPDLRYCRPGYQLSDLMNHHLNLHYYRQFIKQFVNNDHVSTSN